MSKALMIRSVSLTPDMTPLRAVQLEDGEVGATLQSLCRALHVNIFGQQKRIARSHNLRNASTIVRIATNGGPQEMTVMFAWAIPLWVIGIQVNRLDAAKRAHILIIQTQAVQALYRAFSNTVSDVVPPTEGVIKPEIVFSSNLHAPLEARLTALEKTVDKLIEETKSLNARDRTNERLLASAIERLLWLQDVVIPRDRQQEQKPRLRRRGRPRRGR